MTEDAKVLHFELRDYLQVLRRRMWTVALTFLLVLGTGVGLTLREDPVYRSSGQILLEGNDGDGSRVPDLTTDIRLLESQAVRDIAIKENPMVGQVSGRQAGASRIVTVAVESFDPKLAAESVDTYFRAFTDFRREQAVERFVSEGQRLQSKIDEARKEVDSFTAQLDQGRQEIDSRYGISPADTRLRELAARDLRSVEERLKPRRDAALGRQLLLEGRLMELNSAAGEIREVQVITPPTVPTTPVRPKPVSTGILAGATGLLLGVLLALLFEYLDDSIKSTEDVERAIGSGVPVAALIPSAPSTRRSDGAEVISLTAPQSPVAEAYRALRTSVQFLDLEEGLTALAITSALSGEGKTTTLANLAVLMAGTGRRTLVLDCDLRRPRIHECFGLSNDVGFTSVLIGAAPLSAAVQKVPGTRNLALLSSGPIPPNPSELLSSRRFRDLIVSLKSDDTLVLVDTPPLLPVTDAAIIAASMGQVLLVSSTRRGTRKQLRQAVDILRRVDAPLTGIVLNHAGVERRGYSYGYHHDTMPTPPAGGGGNGSGAQVISRASAAERRARPPVPYREQSSP